MPLTTYAQKKCFKTSIQIPPAKHDAWPSPLLWEIRVYCSHEGWGKGGRTYQVISWPLQWGMWIFGLRWNNFNRSVSCLCVVHLRWNIETARCVDYGNGRSPLVLLSHQAQAGPRILIAHFSYQVSPSCFISFLSWAHRGLVTEF